jgi:hypothetical protein
MASFSFAPQGSTKTHIKSQRRPDPGAEDVETIPADTDKDKRKAMKLHYCNNFS